MLTIGLQKFKTSWFCAGQNQRTVSYILANFSPKQRAGGRDNDMQKNARQAPRAAGQEP